MANEEFHKNLVENSMNRTRGMIEALAELGSQIDVSNLDADPDGGYEMLIDIIDDLLARLNNKSYGRSDELMKMKGKFTGYIEILNLIRSATSLTGHG